MLLICFNLFFTEYGLEYASCLFYIVNIQKLSKNYYDFILILVSILINLFFIILETKINYIFEQIVFVLFSILYNFGVILYINNNNNYDVFFLIKNLFTKSKEEIRDTKLNYHY